MVIEYDPMAKPKKKAEPTKDEAKELVTQLSSSEEKIATLPEATVVKTKKKGFMERVLGDNRTSDGKTVPEYLMSNIVLPAVQNFIVDFVTSGINMLIYGSEGSNRSTYKNRPSGVGTSWEPYYERKQRSQQPMANNRSYNATSSSNFEDVILPERGMCTYLLSEMRNTIERYGTVSVLDMNDILWKSYNMKLPNVTYTDERYGWSNLDYADIRSYRGDWWLKLPTPMPIER